MKLTEQIISAREYLKRFDDGNYPICFQAFEEACVPLFEDLEETALAGSAAALIEELEAEMAALPRRKRALTAEQDMRVLALFLSPAAARHGEKAAAFSALLQEQWNQKHPKYNYRQGSYESIMEGFEVSILGIPLSRFKKRGDRP